jgi:pilus assembly protein CpaB
MNRRLSIILLCAFVLSVCVSYLVYRAVSNTAPAPLHTVGVVVAARDLTVGSLVRAADLTLASWSGPLPAGAILKRDSVLNRGVIASIYEGEPVTENRLSLTGSGGGLAATIPPGLRACAVKVNDVVGVAGFVVSGMRVDVLITGLPPGGNALDGPKVRTLLQNIQVLSAGTDFQKDKEGKPQQAQVVNLLVTPSQAEILSLAANEMHIQLVLRNPVDTGISTPPGTVMSDLFSAGRAPEARRPASPRSEIPVAQPALAATQTPGQSATQPPSTRSYVIEVSNGSVHTEARFTRPPEKQ